jgi:hypothetical protein
LSGISRGKRGLRELAQASQSAREHDVIRRSFRVTSNPLGLAAWCAAAASFAALTAGANSAEAQNPSCASLGSEAAPLIYGRGGSAASVLIGRFAVAIKESSQPLTVVYKDDGACYAMESLINGQKLTSDAKYWVREGDKIVAKTCTLPVDQVDGLTASWGAMAQQATTCPGVDALPNTIADVIGPNSGFSIVVPNASNQQVISAEALYYIYGLGVEDLAHQVAPWTVPGAIGSRKTTSAAGLLLAKAAGIDLSHPLYRSGTSEDPQNDVKNNQGAVDWITTKQAAIENPDAAIAFCSTETADANRSKVRTLAFQAYGQEYGYWPDSNATTRYDKINIREGRYFLWNPHHFFATLDGPNGEIADANTKRWIGYLTGTEPLPDGLKAVDLQIEVGTVPECAMHVNRDEDVGPLYSYQPDEPCGCYFELKATGAAGESCIECTEETEATACPSAAPKCRHGYCEVK